MHIGAEAVQSVAMTLSASSLCNSAGASKFRLQVLPLPGIDLGLQPLMLLLSLTSEVLPYENKSHSLWLALKDKGLTWGLLAWEP